ncbi:uncharacterized protein K452DRAFT_303056 [Aplosporella prunicola CBS 121167]|uniref:Uncharacterized protein n=1 Tax=Aplosporella prunicola CBS 121167 TaxID=1176127 RepID=A0A6A6AZ68_9PEZI|nr:uncharacterized protein K452DRAFT_303056 [Aplosporella prunicola CBS 121167]KAF2136077.1 hypothetical protein K452DRAFT_303056 [Aplosporella prunicola CBS 121167]
MDAEVVRRSFAVKDDQGCIDTMTLLPVNTSYNFHDYCVCNGMIRGIGRVFGNWRRV